MYIGLKKIVPLQLMVETSTVVVDSYIKPPSHFLLIVLIAIYYFIRGNLSFQII